MPTTQYENAESSAAALRGPAANDEGDPRGLVQSDESETAHYLSVRELREQFFDYLTVKVDEIEEQKNARRYYHGAHWTSDQIRILRERHQWPFTWNRISRKINGIVGLVERMRSDPKAMARTPKSEQGAEISTQAIRYVLDRAEFKNGTDPWCLNQACIDGIAGVQLVLTQGDKGDPDLTLAWVIGDEYFYDPKSYRMDFADKRYNGIAKWMDVDEAIDLFPDKEELLRGLVEGDSDLSTNSDRDYKWVITATKRVRIVEHWYKHKGRWCWAFYVSTVLLDEGASPFYDENGKSVDSFQMFSCAVDHDSDRYGFVRNLRGPQDALNQAKSKSLHIANTRLVKWTKGVVDDAETTRREVARPDGTIELNPIPGAIFEIVDTKADLAAFDKFGEDAKNELDQFANVNFATLSGVQLTNLSGRAIELLRQPGMAELGPFILSYRGWKLGLYRRIWNAIQRYWTAERWIRVTNNEGLGQFIQLNGLAADQWGRPTIVNAVGALDVDITLEEGPDIGTLMADTNEALKGYPPGTFPPQVLIETSQLPRSEKNRIVQMLTPKPQPPNPMQQMAAKLQLEGAAAELAHKGAKVRETHAAAELKLAGADEKRAKAGTLALGGHIDAAEFARDTLMQATEIERQVAQPQGQQPQNDLAGLLGQAKQAPDRHLYVPDRNRPGKYLRVVPRAQNVPA